jgi:hypothetical protein
MKQLKYLSESFSEIKLAKYLIFRSGRIGIHGESDEEKSSFNSFQLKINYLIKSTLL